MNTKELLDSGKSHIVTDRDEIIYEISKRNDGKRIKFKDNFSLDDVVQLISYSKSVITELEKLLISCPCSGDKCKCLDTKSI